MSDPSPLIKVKIKELLSLLETVSINNEEVQNDPYTLLILSNFPAYIKGTHFGKLLIKKSYSGKIKQLLNANTKSLIEKTGKAPGPVVCYIHSIKTHIPLFIESN
jgi:hypothetical protein